VVVARPDGAERAARAAEAATLLAALAADDVPALTRPDLADVSLLQLWVLHALVGGRAVATGTIARRIGAGPAEVAAALGQLAERGLVDWSPRRAARLRPEGGQLLADAAAPGLGRARLVDLLRRLPEPSLVELADVVRSLVQAAEAERDA